MPAKISYEERGHIALIGLNRPEKRNAFDAEMIEALADAYTRLAQSPTLRCGVVFAHGDHFTAGLDLGSLAAQLGSEGIGALQRPGKTDPWGIASEQCPKPVIVAVKGYCYTAGIELMLAADVVVAARGTRFAQLEPARGFMAFGGATIRWPLLTGPQNALRWLLTAEEFGAEEAYRTGLVQELTEPGDELERALAIAERIAAQAPLAVQGTLRSVRLALARGQRAAIEALRPEVERQLASNDAKRGAEAFRTRTPAAFEGD